MIKRVHRNQIAPHRSPSQELNIALDYFTNNLEMAIGMLARLIQYDVASSPEFHSFYTLDSESYMTKTERGTPDDHLLWLLDQVFDFKKTFHFAGYPYLLNELDTLITQDLDQRKRLPSATVRYISHLGLKAEFWRQILPSRSGPSLTPHILPSKLTERSSWREDIITRVNAPFYEIGIKAKKASWIGHLRYPSDLPRTASVTIEMQMAEKELDAFWAKIDRYVHRESGEHIADLLPKTLNGRSLQRTPDWVQPGRRRFLEENLGERNSQLSMDCSSMTANLDTVFSIRTKPKTRGVPVPPMPPSESSPPQDHRKPLYSVSRRVHKVFASFFHSPNQDGVPGDLPWSEFLHAMAAIGCKVEKLNGSAWYFEPPNDSRSISFYEPHSTSKIPFKWVRQFGRRLERAHGWTKDTFVKGQTGL